MFRLALRPSPIGLALGLAVVVFWAILWLVFLSQLLAAPQKTARQAGQVPELARIEPRAGTSSGT